MNTEKAKKAVIMLNEWAEENGVSYLNLGMFPNAKSMKNAYLTFRRGDNKNYEELVVELKMEAAKND